MPQPVVLPPSIPSAYPVESTLTITLKIECNSAEEYNYIHAVSEEGALIPSPDLEADVVDILCEAGLSVLSINQKTPKEIQTLLASRLP